ncbi:MAG: hypothetical protein KAR38_10265, partial [Calditrichia bacterium]|nr:hypothetical protein [Calditrichia bacterium]
LKPFFKQWVERKGAPELSLSGVKVKKEKDGYKLKFTLKQKQKEDVFNLNVPVAVSFKDNAKIEKVTMVKKKQAFELSSKEKPLLIQIDPQFQLFRKLHYYEIPPALSKIYGSEEILIILPAKAGKVQLDNYKKLAEKWAKDKTKKIEIKLDSEVSELPADKAVWVFGHENAYKNVIKKGIEDYDAEIADNTIRFAKATLKSEENSFIAAVRHPKNHNSVVAWLTIEKPEAANGLARKLLHYGKYSYLAFEGDEPTNIAKGQWKAVHSPLAKEIKWDGKEKTGEAFTDLPKRKALEYLAPVFSSDRMMKYVEFLASDELKGRGLGTPEIDKAADYIAEQFKKAG